MRHLKLATTLIGASFLAVALAGTASAQVSPFPNTNVGNGQLIQQGVTGSRGTGSSGSTRFEQRQNDQARYSVQQQSCGGLSGVSADRCNSELRATIESDKLRNQAIDAGQPRSR